MTEKPITCQEIRDHLDVSKNHEAGLIPVSTQILLERVIETIMADCGTSLVDLVENYLTRSGIGESYFGAAACGNSNFVKRMRDGGRFFPETEAKVRAFIANNPAP